MTDDLLHRLDAVEANLQKAARLKRIMEFIIGAETAAIVWLLVTR